MKKVLFAFIALSLLSCSDDDSSTAPSVQKNLDQMVITHYPDGLAAPNHKEVHDFDDHNKITQISYFSPQNELAAKRTYQYNQMGLLSVVKTYGYDMGMGDPNEPKSVVSFNYDSSLRIIGIDSNIVYGIEGVHTVTSFTYNADNTISVEEITSSPPEEDVVKNYTYHKNTDGRITKLVDSEGTVYTQAVFEGANVLSYTKTGSASMSYAFNVNDTPKGDYLKINTNKYDGSFNNTIMAEGFQAVGNGVSNYISQDTYSMEGVSGTTNYAYDFDQDGFPKKVSLSVQGSSTPHQIREITYQ